MDVGRELVCKSEKKKFYDTEFEAERAANIMAFKHGEDFVYYTCGRHFHVTHLDPRLRSGAKKAKKQLKCQKCNQFIERGKEITHLKYCQGN